MDNSNSNLPFQELEAGDSKGFLLWQLTTLWHRAINAALKPYGLTQVQFVLLASVLWLSSKGKWISQIALANHSKLDVMMTSQVIRTLESRGLIVRHQPSNRHSRKNAEADSNWQEIDAPGCSGG